jgi:hypothetical protein
MLNRTNSKLVVVLLSIVFLLVNPAGFCTDDMVGNTAGHPCCPKAPASVKSACLCIDRQPAMPTVPVPVENVAIIVAPMDVPLPIASVVVKVDVVSYSPPDRFLAFHQFLV